MGDERPVAVRVVCCVGGRYTHSSVYYVVCTGYSRTVYNYNHSFALLHSRYLASTALRLSGTVHRLAV